MGPQEQAVVDYGVVSLSDEDGRFETNEEVQLAKLGKKQVLRRQFGFWTMLALSLTCTTTWEGQLIVFLYGLIDGGPAGVVYEYLFCWAGYLAIIASIAELASIAPVSGGQYHWVYMLSPPRMRMFLSYLTGWHTVLAWQATTAAACYLSATIIQGLLVLNYPDYNFQRWHGTLLMYAVLVPVLLFNVVLAKWLSKLEGILGFLHLALFPCILIPIAYFAPHGTASEVFGDFLRGGGYESSGLTFFVGTIGTVFAFLGADASVHMCEEIRNPSRNVPIVLVGTILINGTLGFAMVIAVLFCIGNVDDAINTPTGYPFLEIFKQAVTNVHSSTAMASFILSVLFIATVSVAVAASRMTWAFARDKGMPGSRWLGHVDPSTKLPLWSIAFTVLVTVLLAPINIGSSAGFNALVSLSVSGSLGSYIPPVVLLMYHRIKYPRGDPKHLAPGRFSLGWAAWPINIFGLVWVVLVMFFSFWPTAVPVTLESMNWSCLLYGAMIIFIVSFYFIYGHKRYNGPVIETNEAELAA